MQEYRLFKPHKGDRIEMSEDAIKGEVIVGGYVYISSNSPHLHMKGEDELKFGIIIEIYGYWKTFKLRFQRLKTKHILSVFKAIWIASKHILDRQCIIECIK